MRPKFLLAAATSMLVGLAQTADAPNVSDLPPLCPMPVAIPRNSSIPMPTLETDSLVSHGMPVYEPGCHNPLFEPPRKT